VKAVHETGIPVILRTHDEIDMWLDAAISEALSLQISLPNGVRKIVRRGTQEDTG
jgi:hypothetical protein